MNEQHGICGAAYTESESNIYYCKLLPGHAGPHYSESGNYYLRWGHDNKVTARMFTEEELAERMRLDRTRDPIPMLLWCPKCYERHHDTGVFASKPHHTHACQYCGMVWRPAVVNTVGVRFLPGFKDEAES